MLEAISEILSKIIGLANMLLIIWFLIGLAFAFNVVSPRNQFVFAVHDALSKLFEPVLRPIRRLMPDTGAIDFSPMVFIMILWSLGRIVPALGTL